MLKRKVTKRGLLAALLVFGGALGGPAAGDYAQYGRGMQTILNGTGIVNGGLYLQANTTWVNTDDCNTPPGGNGVPKPYDLQTGFALPACDSIVEARLLMTVWGAKADYTCDVSVAVNGGSVVTNMAMGSTSDANPTFDDANACAYGTGYGVWLVAVPVPAAQLNTDGNTNLVAVTIDDSTQLFDARVQQVTLLAVYQQAALNNTFDYLVAEGSGDIYRDEDPNQVPPKVESRTVSLGAADTSGVTAAKLHALYTYGTDEQNDRLYFNGVQCGGDDVADFDDDTSPYDYGPDLVEFDVLGLLAGTNSIKFTVSDADGVPDTREYSLRPQLAVLEVTHVPEPAAVLILVLGATGLMRRRRMPSP